MELWIGTSNGGKLNEFKTLLTEIDIDVHSQSELPVYTSPVENGNSFEENARIKAKSLRAVKSDVWVVAEDSGLEVEGLNRLPGIHSARYAGPKAADSENNMKLLKMMSLRSPSNRAAQFRCVMIAYSPTGEEHVFEGTMNGSISKAVKGTAGFGYDVVFVPEGEEKTLAELGLGLKNKVSHRAQAIRKFRELL